MTGFTLRPVRIEDVAAINEMRRLPGVRRHTLALSSERVSHNRRYLESMGADDHLLVAEVEGRVVGLAGLHVMGGKQRHVASAGIMVHDDFQGRGIGRGLMQALLDLADHELGLTRVELDVHEPNARAIRLYESLGFEREGRKRGAVLIDGVPRDVLVMGRLRS